MRNRRSIGRRNPAHSTFAKLFTAAAPQKGRFDFEKLEQRQLFSTYAAYDLPKTVADLATVRSTINVTGQSGTVSDVNVNVALDHTWDADVDAFLVAPNGQRVELFTDDGGSGDNFRSTKLDDQASGSIANGAAPFTGTFRPEGSLSQLNGISPNGVWTLEITDDEGGDTGTLRSWSLEVQTGSTTSQSPVQAATGFYFPAPFATGDTNWLAQGSAYEAGKIHFGSDLRTAKATPVFAVGDGTVLDRRADGFGNEVLFVQHQSSQGSFVAVYAHVTANVNRGDTVHAGAQIASVGDYLQNGPGDDHLHFGVRPGTIIPPSDGVHYGWGRADVSWYQVNGTNGFVAPINYITTYHPSSQSSNSAPAAPTNFRFSRTGAGQGVLWWNDNSNDELGFSLQVWTGSAWSTFYTASANTIGVGVSMTVGYTYQLRVVAFNSYGLSPSNSTFVTG